MSEYEYWLWLRLGVNVDDQLWLRLNPNPIPNRHHLEVNNNELTNSNKPRVLVVCQTAPACWPMARLQQAVRKSSLQGIATPRRKCSHCVW